jgi:hypothetical protein
MRVVGRLSRSDQGHWWSGLIFVPADANC